MIERLWLEFVPDISTLRVYARSSKHLKVDKLNDRLMITCGSDSIEFPIAPDSSPYISPPDVSEDLTIISVRAQNATAEMVHEWFKNSSTLFEDWSSVVDNTPLRCRACNTVCDSLSLTNFTPCLLPSATWGFEDMRVCEECGPLVVGGDIRTHRHEKKSKRKNFYIDHNEIFIQIELENDLICECCETVLGTKNLSPGSSAKLAVVGDVDGYVEIEKSQISGPPFLAAYVEQTNETECLLQYLENDEDAKLIPDELKKLSIRPLSRTKYDVIVIPASTKSPCWGIRLMYLDDTLDDVFREKIAKFSIPSPLKKNWKTSILAPISPQILDS